MRLKAVYVSPHDFMGHYIFDLSLGGLFIETTNPFNPGQEFDLRIFLLDEAEPMEVPCQVMWSRKQEEPNPRGKRLPAGMGVKFVKLSEENLERLIGILNRSLG